jgi:hypothetical protein
MKVVERSGYSGWNDYPVYRVRSFQDWLDLIGWMKENHVEHFLLSSGYGGYVFQVKSNAEWFALRWE